MKRFTLFVLAVAAVLVVATSSLSAQDQPTKIVFVDAQAAINSHPAGQAANQLQEQARTEIAGLRADIDALAQKIRAGQTLNADEQERYNLLLTTLDSVQQRYQTEIAQTAQPAIEAVNEVIRQIAEENGYTIVLDAGVASAGLVVYAQDGLFITAQVIERLRSQP